MKIHQSLVRFFLVCISLSVWLYSAFTSLNSQTKYKLFVNHQLLQESERIALDQIGTQEATNNNDGVQIQKYQKAAGIKKNSSYCYAGIYYTFSEACKKLSLADSSNPLPQSGLANSVFNYAIKRASRTLYKPERHDLIVWRAKNLINGHIERIYKLMKAGWVKTIAFNTSIKDESGKRIEGVFFKNRNIYHPLGRLAIRGLVGWIYQ